MLYLIFCLWDFCGHRFPHQWDGRVRIHTVGEFYLLRIKSCTDCQRERKEVSLMRSKRPDFPSCWKRNSTSCAVSSDAGDKDARDSVRMRLEQRLRDGQEDGSVVRCQVGNFERHTKVSTVSYMPTSPVTLICSSGATSQFFYL